MSASLSLRRNQVTAGGDAEREGQVRAAGWQIVDDGYARTTGFSLPPLIGKILDQSQAVGGGGASAARGRRRRRGLIWPQSEFEGL